MTQALYRKNLRLPVLPANRAVDVLPRAVCCALLVVSAGAYSRPVLMVSVDGMKPEYVSQADRYGLKIPFLRSMLRSGATAQGVVGVWPTVTYPSHTTLVTGVSPAVHGVINNLEFDPQHTFGGAWYWYAAQIRVPTLWGAAHAAGLATASVGWPVTAGARDIDFLIPEYWRFNGETSDLPEADEMLMAALARPPGLLEDLRTRLGPYLRGNDPGASGDVIKTRYALALLQTKKPAFMTVHLSSLDEAEHGHGPFSRDANTALEAIDRQLAQLAAAAIANDAQSAVVVVSDHGFMPLQHRVNLLLPFFRAGLMHATQDPATKALRVTSWQAQPWSAGGMAAVVLAEPSAPELEARVRELLRALAGDARNGVASVSERQEIAQRGAFPQASFMVVMQPGFTIVQDLAAAAAGGEAGMVSDVQGAAGGHGFSPDYPQMRAALLINGQGIAQHRDLGVIDMRQIAPTVAQLLQVSWPSTGAAPLKLLP